jgi:anaerobic selenocysteine-containing dehydrogenase
VSPVNDLLSRRNFLFYGGAAVAGVTLGQVARRQIAWADERAAAREPGEERWAVSVCRECPASCGVQVRLIDGRPVKFEGNPLCPISRGRLCAKGQAAVEAYYDPDRLTGPAKRIGPHGSGTWQRISWEEATGLLAGRLKSTTGRRGEVLAIAAEETSPAAEVWQRVWRAAGARVHSTSMTTAARLRERWTALTGVAAEPCFDVEHATHVLSFGAPVVEDWLSPLWTQRTFGRFRRSSGRPRGRLVQVEGRKSLTARKADEWIAVPANRQVALAYGIAAVLLRENRIDRAALDPYLQNLNDFEQAVTTRFTPDEVAAATGVPVVTVLRLARDLVSAEQPLVIVNADASRELVDAVLALDMLLGAFDRPGGIYAASPLVYSAQPADAGTGETDAPPRVIVFRDSAEFRSLATTPDLEPALNSADLVVSYSPFLDEAASVADLLLPTHTSLESWHAVVPATCLPSQLIAIARPATTPALDTRDVIQILKTVSDAVGGPMAAACPWSSSEALVGDQLARLAATRRGGPYASNYETEWMLQLERGGWWTAAAALPEEIADAIANAGGWADPFFEEGQIRRRLVESGGCSFPAPPVLPSAPLSPVILDSLHPLQMETFVPVVVNQLGSPNQPVLFELLGQPEARPWGPWVELGPETARTVGVATGEQVRVESASGAIDASVVIVEHMQPGVVAVAFVPAVPNGGRWAREIVRDVRSLAREDALRAGPVAVRIARG